MKKITNSEQLKDLIENSIITVDDDGINRIETVEQFNEWILKPYLNGIIGGKIFKTVPIFEWEIRESKYPIDSFTLEMIISNSIQDIQKYFSKDWGINIKENKDTLIKNLSKILDKKLFRQKEMYLVEEWDIKELIYEFQVR